LKHAPRGLCIGALAIAAALPGASARAQSQPAAACFNGGEARTPVAVWIFEGYSDWRSAYTDWRAAQTGSPPVLVFSFVPGKSAYGAGELVGCFFMPADAREKVYRCESGGVRVTRLDLPNSISGEYRLSLSNATGRSLAFNATYCPPFRR
jgi:hypothetical protein